MVRGEREAACRATRTRTGIAEGFISPCGACASDARVFADDVSMLFENVRGYTAGDEAAGTSQKMSCDCHYFPGTRVHIILYQMSSQDNRGMPHAFNSLHPISTAQSMLAFPWLVAISLFYRQGA